MNKREVGSCYEELAAVYLQEKGCRALERNYRCRQGEVDLTCTQGPCLVLMEVRYQIDSRMGGPLKVADKRKQRCVHQATARYVYSHGSAEDCTCRFGVVGILGEWIGLVQDALQIRFARR